MTKFSTFPVSEDPNESNLTLEYISHIILCHWQNIDDTDSYLLLLKQSTCSFHCYTSFVSQLFLIRLAYFLSCPQRETGESVPRDFCSILVK